MFPLQIGLPGGPELLIVGLVYLIVPFVLAYWTYNDAERHGDDNAALWALAVGVLTIMTLVGGFLALAVYLWQRD